MRREIANGDEQYHINHATCHDCPCKNNFDSMKSQLSQANAELERVRKVGVEDVIRLIKDYHDCCGGELCMTYPKYETAQEIAQAIHALYNGEGK